jgi:hypothetical protein
MSALTPIASISLQRPNGREVPAMDMMLQPPDFALSQFEILAVDSGQFEKGSKS